MTTSKRFMGCSSTCPECGSCAFYIQPDYIGECEDCGLVIDYSEEENVNEE